MKKIINKVEELIGNTPIFKFNNEDYGIPKNVNIYAKLEYYNPGGSIKDRTVIYMLEKAEKKEILKKGDTILEGTAGNTGIGLALIGGQKGYKIKIVVPEKYSKEKQIIMKALGAEIYNTPTEKGMEGAYEKINELMVNIPDAYVLGQYDNEDNPKAHYKITGPEIYNDMNGQIDIFVAGAGTGGTYSGITRYLKEKNPKIKGVLADPEGSVLGGGESGFYKVEGIGSHFIPDVMDMSLVDEVIYINDEESFKYCKEIAKKSGLTVGGSSGANFAAALEFAKNYEGSREINIVTLMPDRSERYFSKDIYGFGNE